MFFVSMLSNIIPVYSEGYENVSITKTNMDKCPERMSLSNMFIILLACVISSICVHCILYTRTFNRMYNRVRNKDTTIDETLCERIDRHIIC